MNKHKPDIGAPLFLTVIPANILGAILFFEFDHAPNNYILTYPTVVIAFASMISLILIRKHNVDYISAYKRTLITGVFLFVGAILLTVVLFAIRISLVAVVCGIAYTFLSVFLVAKRVRRALNEQNELSEDKPKLVHILAITFINPLLPFMPLLMAVAYALASFDGLSIK